jgi:hypothetical protein
MLVLPRLVTRQPTPQRLLFFFLSAHALYLSSRVLSCSLFRSFFCSLVLSLLSLCLYLLRSLAMSVCLVHSNYESVRLVLESPFELAWSAASFSKQEQRQDRTRSLTRTQNKHCSFLFLRAVSPPGCCRWLCRVFWSTLLSAMSCWLSLCTTVTCQASQLRLLRSRLRLFFFVSPLSRLVSRGFLVFTTTIEPAAALRCAASTLPSRPANMLCSLCFSSLFFLLAVSLFTVVCAW